MDGVERTENIVGVDVVVVVGTRGEGTTEIRGVEGRG